MSLFAGVTRMGRTIAEAKMGSVCVIRRAAGSTPDPVTGVEVPTFTVVYSGPCSFKYSATLPNDLVVTGEQLVSQRPTLSLPVATSAGVRVDDVATITENALDAGLVGVVARVAGVHAITHGTARRLPVEVIS